MPTPTYDLIASNVLTSSASSVTFSSIPATYRDLVLVITGNGLSGDGPLARVNGDTGNNYFNVVMSGAAAGTSSGSATNNFLRVQNFNTSSSNTFLSIMQFMDYSATDKHKTVLTRGNDIAETKEVTAFASRWANTAAINEILVYGFSASFTAGSSFYLYGIVS